MKSLDFKKLWQNTAYILWTDFLKLYKDCNEIFVLKKVNYDDEKVKLCFLAENVTIKY